MHCHAADALFAALEKAGGDVLLSSPYLTLDVAKRLAGIASNSKFDWLLLTRLDAPAVANGYLSVEGLDALLDARVRLVDCQRLHAKVYLVGDGFGLVGSANLTGSGLGTATAKNLEITVRLDPSQVPAIRDQLRKWETTGKIVDSARLITLAKEAEGLPRSRRTPSSRTGATAPTTADVEQLLADARHRQLWAKGHYGDAYLDGWRKKSWFSSPAKARPRFAPSDLVVIYSLAARGVYAVVEVVDEAVEDSAFVAEQLGSHEAGDRWPYVNRTVPRLVPERLILVTPDQLGFSGQGVQNGHRKLTLSEFAGAVRVLADQM